MALLKEIFLHRQNFGDVVPNYIDGVEIDIRSSKNGLVLTHDRVDHTLNNEYPTLVNSIPLFKNKKIILNIKESGLEEECIQLLDGEDYYFLDSQLPDILKLSKKFTNIRSRFIIRISDAESVSKNLLLSIVSPKYIWLDYSVFTENSDRYYKEFVSYAYHDLYLVYTNHFPEIIVVSPELYSLDNKPLIKTVKEVIEASGFRTYNVCTKYPLEWRS